MKIDALPAFTDNYIWLLQDTQQQRCAVVDPGDMAPVQAWLDEHPDWQLTDILVTHHHHDHVGGVEALKARHGARVFGPANERIPGLDQALEDGQRINILGCDLQVLTVPGHTLGHIAYFHDDGTTPWLLCGDTLFAAGCGRIFEGTAEQMYNSLQRLADLPEHTLVYCTHEYTLSNLRFAHAVEPENPAIQKRIEQVTALREEGGISLPSTLRSERESNPFLRCSESAVVEACRQRGLQDESPQAVFAVLRRWKDTF